MYKVHMHTGAIRKSLYGCAYVWEIILSLKLVDYLPIHTHKPDNNLQMLVLLFHLVCSKRNITKTLNTGGFRNDHKNVQFRSDPEKSSHKNLLTHKNNQISETPQNYIGNQNVKPPNKIDQAYVFI